MTERLEDTPLADPDLDDLKVSGTEDIERAFWDELRPEPLMTVAEWAQERRRLAQSTSGEPGRWRNERTPYLVEIMNCLSATSTVETVVFLAGSQVGKTEVGNNWMGYIVDIAPGPMLFVLPTGKAAENVSKERLKPLFRETPALEGKVSDARKPGSGTTLTRKEFEGGFVKLVSAEAPTQLRSTPARYLFGDEVDAYPESAGDEGDPCELAARAQITFRRRKRLWTSTPTVEGHSKIQRLFERTDQSVYLVPCPHCGHEQQLEWSQLIFDAAARGETLEKSIHYKCSGCDGEIAESAKDEMIAKGRWEATAESADGKSRGFHLNALYSPFFAWVDLVRKFLEAKDDPALLQVFVNLYLADTWKEKAEVPDWNRLMDRREPYEIGTVPRGGVFLTAGVDVQHDRYELEVVAWGPGRESWSVDYQILDGATDKPETQAKLRRALARTYRHESGVDLSIRQSAIDSSDQTSMVYALVKTLDRSIAVKGRDTSAQVISQPTYMTAKASSRKRRMRAGAPVYMVGTHVVKEELYRALRLPTPQEDEETPIGFCHFPEAYPAAYFKGLTAEELVRRKNRKGYVVREWRKTSERNEPLDCRVYARAAAAKVGLDRWKAERWARERADAGLDAAPFAPPHGERPARRKRRRGGDSRFNRWRKP